MDTKTEAGVLKQDGEACVVQIYPRLTLDTAGYCPLQIGPEDTARMVIHNAVITLGLDSNQTYNLLEVTKRDGKERLIKAEDCPLDRVLLWPIEKRKWHTQSQGYYFILQPQRNNRGNQVDSATEDYDDLCNLSNVTEEKVLEVLQERFYERKIYTYIHNILIAVNPNMFLPAYYNPKYVKKYENQPLGQLSPHIFAIADVAFRTMLSRQTDQCIVISGECGSGKTESSRYLVHCLTALSKKAYSTGLERSILGAGPVLEAFGNAKTAENNNSSRFGKFFQINYLESGVIRGAVIEKFLLEKSRLVSRNKSDRNFHVFYYLLAGASKEEREEFHLLKPHDYVYLKQDNLNLDDEGNLGQEYKKLHQAMEMVGFLASTKKHIFSIISAILHLGNVTYTRSEELRRLEAGPADVLSTLSNLLKVKKESLVTALTKRKVVTAHSRAVFEYTLQEATTVRDSMAKSLYGALFDWIVFHINHALLNRRDMEESVSCLSIGIMDMFGFENLQTNSFEQLCINYSNEVLQNYINQQIFQLEQDVYRSEGITWQNINFTDNTGCIDLMSNMSTGLFHLLDEESKLPRATDKTLLDRLKQEHRNSPIFDASEKNEPAFVIQHFAGKVQYHIKDFRKKNTEHMRPEVVSLLRGSESSFLHHLVASSPEALFRWGILRATIRIVTVFKNLARQRAELLAEKRNSRKSLQQIARERLASNTLDFSFDHSDDQSFDMSGDFFLNTFEQKRKSRDIRQKQVIPKNLIDVRSLQHIVNLMAHDRTSKSIFHPYRRTELPTVSTQFQGSLKKLIETAEKADPFFIFCVRSNAEMREVHFDPELVLKQVRYLGLLPIVQIQKSGYDGKFTFQEFVKKFRILFPKGATATPEQITKLFERLDLDKSTYQIGKTKVFLKENEQKMLLATYNKDVMERIITLQRWFRTCLIRSHFLQKKDATKLIQRSWRGFYEKQNRAATVIQEAWRSSLKRSDKEQTQHEDSLEESAAGSRSSKKELKRQGKMELSPSKTRQCDPARSQVELRERNKEKQARASTPPLNRPLSLPFDGKVSTDQTPSSALKRYTEVGDMRQKVERWKEQNSDYYPTDDSSPEIHRRRETKKKEFCQKGKSLSVDELCRIGSSGSDTSPSKTEVRMRRRKPQKHKRRLANARSGLMVNFGGSKESEYWSFPLPPISPAMPSMRSSTSSLDFQLFQSQGKRPAEPDGLRYSLPPKPYEEDSNTPHQAQLTTPEKVWFLTKLLKKRPPKNASNTNPVSDKSVTLPSYNPQFYQKQNQNGGKSLRSPTIRISRATRALQGSVSLEREITDPKELRNLDEFLGNQVNELRTRVKELSLTENIFLMATMQFRDTIKSMYSLQNLQITYNDLMKGYCNQANTLAGSKNKGMVSLVVNLFESVLDGFIRAEIKRVESEPAKTLKKRKKEKCFDNPLDHRFNTYQVNIMQSCDLCGSYIWGMEKAYMCDACKLICHKKCLNKIVTNCSTRCNRQDDSSSGSLHFGVQVCALTSKTNPVPKVVELLLIHVELNGLYTEGIYRKSGSACKAKELHQILETNPETAHLENYSIHTITGLVKRWLRELPDPLLTFSLYNDFLQAADLPEKEDRIKAMYQKVDELPPANYTTLERLIFHLVRVAKEEDHNKMSPGSLAIVFAPCLLRSPTSPDNSDPLLSMRDVSKMTVCVETLITEQFRRYNERMENIKQLEFAETQAINELKVKRQNTVLERPSELVVPNLINSDDLEKSILERIKSIKEEKMDLACRLPDLEHEQSDGEYSSSSMSSESIDRLVLPESEGKMKVQLKTHKSELQNRPVDLAQRVRSLMAQTDDEHRELTSEKHTEMTHSISALTSQDSPSPPNNQLLTKTKNWIFDNLDIPYIDE